MWSDEETFFTLVGCMDGRVQNILVKFGKEKFNARYPDTITEAGLVGQLAKEQPDKHLLDSLKFKILDVSLGKHHSKGIVVHGHQECAGNPVTDEQHKKDVLKAAGVIRSVVNNSVPVTAVFVTQVSHGWTAIELT